jgi:hypothetical protein
MSMNRKELETKAIRANEAGMTWPEFWPTVAGDVAALEPWDLEARRKLVRRLSLLLVAGDLDGDRPAHRPGTGAWRRVPVLQQDLQRPAPRYAKPRGTAGKFVSNDDYRLLTKRKKAR